MKWRGLSVILVLACGSVSAPRPDGGGDGPPAGGFTLAANAADSILRQGGSLTVDVTLTRDSSFTDPVEVTAGGLPAGVTATPVTIPAGSTTGSLSLAAAADATQGGPFTVTVTGTAGDAGDSVDVVVLVGGAPGTLDLSFGGGTGKVVARIGGVGTVGRGMRIQPDGKILVTSASNSGQAATMRLNVDGSYDNGFGSGGFVSTGMGTTAGGIDVEVLSSGAVIVGGWSGISGDTNYTLFGYTADGVLDSSFGTAGIATFAVSGAAYAEIHRVRVDSTGSIIAFGATFSTPSDSHLLRYDGTTKMLLPAWNDLSIILETGTVQGDGMVLAAGTATSDYWIGRFTPALAKDLNFDSDGAVTTDQGGLIDSANALFELAGGKILAVGLSDAAAAPMPRVSFARYNPNGSLDLTFGTGGKRVGTEAFDSGAPTMAEMDGQGRLVVAGYKPQTTGQPIAVARYSADGLIDAIFGTAGIAAVDFGLVNGNRAGAYGVGLDEYGRVVISAAVGSDTDGSIGVARLWP